MSSHGRLTDWAGARRLSTRPRTAAIVGALAAAVALPVGAGSAIAAEPATAEASREWTAPASFGPTANDFAVSMSSGGRATAVWITDDNVAYAARRPLDGGWTQPRRIATNALEVATVTLGNGVPVIMVTTASDVTMYRWADGSIVRGKRFATEVWDGASSQLVANDRGDIMAQWLKHVGSGELWKTKCRYFSVAAESWSKCNDGDHDTDYRQLGSMDDRGVVYGISEASGTTRTVDIYRPRSGWSYRTFTDEELFAISANEHGDALVMSQSWNADSETNHVATSLRPDGGEFQPWRELRAYGGDKGYFQAVALHENAAASATWQEGYDETASVWGASRAPDGTWTTARRLVANAVLGGFAGNPTGDAVVIAGSNQDYADSDDLWAVVRPAGGSYGTPVNLTDTAGSSHTAVAVDDDGNAVVLYNDDTDGLAARVYEAS